MIVALEREHDHDGEEQGDQRDGADLGDELLLVPLPPFGFDECKAGDHAAEEGYAQVDEHALGDLPDGDMYRGAFQPEPSRQHGDEDIGVDGVEKYLEDGVEGHQPGGILAVAFGQLVPDDDHGDAAGQAYHDQAQHVGGIGQRSPGRG